MPDPRKIHGRLNVRFMVLVIAVVVMALLVTIYHSELAGLFQGMLSWIKGAGFIGPVIFIGLYVVACIFMLPGSILTLGAGAVFGVVRGSLLVSLASVLGATAAFLIGRFLARDMVARRVGKRPAFLAIDEAVAVEGWKIVGLTRLSPVFPFNLLNYAFGLTRVSLRDYVLASWFGMMPGTVMYVYLGSLAGSLAELGAKTDDQVRSPAQWALYVLGLVATLGVTLLLTRIARKALRRRIQTGAPQEKPS